jgi:multidrug efflux system membrane fusion protein
MIAKTPRQTRGARRLWIAGTALTALTAVATALFSMKTSSAPPPAAPSATPVSVATVVPSEVATWDEFSGRLEAVERVDIRSRVAGTVQSVHFHEGALVKKGDLLITIDPAPYASDVERASAQVVAAEARNSYAQSEFVREAEANLRAAKAALHSAQLSLGYTEVRAPVAGRVGRLEITVGNLVAAGPGAPVLTTLVSVSPIYASFDADEQIVAKALGELPSGASARAQLERIPVQMTTAGTTGTPFIGHLQLVDNQVDAKSGTVRARAVFDNADGRLMPGQFARLRMGQVKNEPALLVSERAVGTDQNKKYVMVVGSDNKASYREVTLGANVEGLRIVTSGLKAQERIVVNGLQRIRPGALVEPQTVPMALKADAVRATPPRS